jgi:hypothetical protein
MKFNKKILLSVVFNLVLGLILIKVYLNYQYGGFKMLDRCKTYNFKVLKIKEYKGVLYLNDSLKLSTAYKNTTPVEMLYEFIRKGDSIDIKSGSDTLFLYRENKKHWFIYYDNSCQAD